MVSVLKTVIWLLLSCGLIVQPVAAQLAGCCCAGGLNAEASATDDAVETGCPNCRATKEATSQLPSTSDVAQLTSLKDCGCERHAAPSTTTRRPDRLSPVGQAFAAIDSSPAVQADLPKTRIVTVAPPNGRVIQPRILLCTWLI